MAVRGHTDDSGNLLQLLKERRRDIPELEAWLALKQSYTSPLIQNEIIEIMAHMVLRGLVLEINSAEFFTVIADGTTDISGKEQFPIAVRVVQNFLSNEIFLGTYIPPDSKGQTLADAIKDALL
ncbi:hypothetical protein FOCC_FOCC012787 [Frankliniella occidentalis]|nr:hypothetical protein FOCC_FOCC012787 [Frankliniella occidentalis]